MGNKKQYKEAPWIFTGRALYQLQLVKLEEAKKYIPKDLNIVSFFGYTLGGFYLAKYEDSPVGAFEECVALAGIVWNKPTSCAWAARVYVNNREARDHGRQHVGLPSRVCSFSGGRGGGTSRRPNWWDAPLTKPPEGSHPAMASTAPPVNDSAQLRSGEEARVVLQNSERRPKWKPWGRGGKDESHSHPICSFSGFPSGFGRHGPRVRLSLPSFSGLTQEHPSMLRYACHLSANVRVVNPLRLTLSRPPAPTPQLEGAQLPGGEDLTGLLGGKSIVCMAFDDMRMVVHQPRAVASVPAVGNGSDAWRLEEGGSVPTLVGST